MKTRSKTCCSHHHEVCQFFFKENYSCFLQSLLPTLLMKIQTRELLYNLMKSCNLPFCPLVGHLQKHSILPNTLLMKIETGELLYNLTKTHYLMYFFLFLQNSMVQINCSQKVSNSLGVIGGKVYKESPVRFTTGVYQGLCRRSNKLSQMNDLGTNNTTIWS